MMCNCGSKRSELNEEATRFANRPNAEEQPTNRKQLFHNIFFEYTGKTGLTVRGTITGIVYRFNCSGDVKEIDYRDASAMYAVPVLNKTVSPRHT